MYAWELGIKEKMGKISLVQYFLWLSPSHSGTHYAFVTCSEKMYGILLENLAEFIRDRWGSGKWESVRRHAGVDTVAFSTHHVYSETLLQRLSKSACLVNFQHKCCIFISCKNICICISKKLVFMWWSRFSRWMSKNFSRDWACISCSMCRNGMTKSSPSWVANSVTF